MYKKKFLIAGVLVMMLLVAGIGGAVVLAQGPTPTPSAQGNAATLAQLYLQALAQRLGTTVDKLQQAMTGAQTDALDQAVKQGLLTQNQADQMKQRGTGFGLPFGLGRGMQNNAASSIAQAELDAAAKALGMTSADLTTALKTKTLLDLANEKKVDVTKLRTAIADAEKAAIDQAVKDGKLTQAQADSMKANIKPENIDLNRRGFGRLGGLNAPGFQGRPGGMEMPFDRQGGLPNGRFGRR